MHIELRLAKLKDSEDSCQLKPIKDVIYTTPSSTSRQEEHFDTSPISRIPQLDGMTVASDLHETVVVQGECCQKSVYCSDTYIII